jgi:putative transposase
MKLPYQTVFVDTSFLIALLRSNDSDKGSKGFQGLPSRWIVERTFGWLNHFRRLRGDYERQPQTSENFIYVAMISLMLRRLA